MEFIYAMSEYVNAFASRVNNACREYGSGTT